MRADTHHGPEHEAEYIDAGPFVHPKIHLATHGRSIHSGHKATNQEIVLRRSNSLECLLTDRGTEIGDGLSQ
jgi:hypothetical protein